MSAPIDTVAAFHEAKARYEDIQQTQGTHPGVLATCFNDVLSNFIHTVVSNLHKVGHQTSNPTISKLHALDAMVGNMTLID